MNGGGKYHSDKTHCLRGHEFTEENIYRNPSRPNTRFCKECRALHNEARTASKARRKLVNQAEVIEQLLADGWSPAKIARALGGKNSRAASNWSEP